MIFAKVKDKWINGKHLVGIENCEITKKGFAKFLDKCEPFTACKTIDGKYAGSSFILIEFENTLNIEAVMEDDFISSYAFSIIDLYTPDETFIAVIFALKTPIEELCKHIHILETLKRLYPQAKISSPLANFDFIGLPSIYNKMNVLPEKIVQLLAGVY